MGEKQYMDAFNDELNGFKGRVKVRAQARIDEAVKEYEEVCMINDMWHYVHLSINHMY